MKPLGQKAYGSIPHLPGSRLGSGDHTCHEGQAIIATQKKRDKHDYIVVQEKLDGSNVAVAKINGEIVPLVRSGYTALSSPHKQHHYFDYWVKRNIKQFECLLGEGERVSGEWLALAHGTIYDLPHEPFVAFDLIKGYRRATFSECLHRLPRFDFIMPKTLSVNDPFSIEAMFEAIKVSGHGAIDPVEGAIWRVERNGEVDFLTKFVRHDKEDGKYFAEITKRPEVWNIDLKTFFR